MSIVFRPLTEAETDEHDRLAREQATTHAWQLWREYLCEEASGPHPWVLAVEEGQARIECERGCGGQPDFGADGFLYVNARIPVTVDIDAGKTWTYYGWEYYADVYIDPDPGRIDRPAKTVGGGR